MSISTEIVMDALRHCDVRAFVAKVDRNLLISPDNYIPFQLDPTQKETVLPHKHIEDSMDSQHLSRKPS